jgi:thioredoxin reductase (NADPH)
VSSSEQSRTPGAVRNAIVIGSGPSGYSAAIYLARANLAPLVFEGAVTAGGALMNTTDVENFPGFPDGVMGPELMDNLRKQAERFGAELVTDDVTQVDLAADPKVVRAGSDTYYAKTVVLAMGSAYRELGVPGESELSGHGVSWCATCDGFFFRDQDIAVVGGGDSAMEEATFLTRFARRVYVVHRRDTLRASKIMQERAFSNPKIEFVWNTEVLEAVGTDGRLSGLRVRDVDSGVERMLAVTGLFIAIGHDPRSELVRGQVELDDEGYVCTRGGTTHTDVRGVFAAGDLVDHTYRQAITAAGTGCMAALDAERFLAAVEGETATDAGAGWTTADQGHAGDHPASADDPRRGHSLV